jgi:regulatory protein
LISDTGTSEKREEQAHAVCLRLLTVRARTRAELSGQLTKRGYPDDVVSTVLHRLESVGLVDDEDFAGQWVRSRQANAGKGKYALAVELRTKGVDDDVVELAGQFAHQQAEGRAFHQLERVGRRGAHRQDEEAADPVGLLDDLLVGDGLGQQDERKDR